VIDWAEKRARLARAVERAKATARTDTPEYLAWSCEFEVRRDPALSAWVEAALGLKPRGDGALWKRLGIGVCRATVKRDGIWEPFADGDLPREIAGKGVPVLTIPALRGGTLIDGGEVVDVFAVELAPGVPARATGRVYALTGLALGLGLDSFAFDEWRGWSKGLAVVASPLDWVRAHRVWSAPGTPTDKEAAEALAERLKDRPGDLTHLDPETHPTPSGPSGIVAPFLGDPDTDGMPCVWLADLDADQAVGGDALGDEETWFDKWRRRATDRLLLASDPLRGDGEELAALLDRRLAAARKRALPKPAEIQVWRPADRPAKGEAA
jgi:hypothetical protein